MREGFEAEAWIAITRRFTVVGVLSLHYARAQKLGLWLDRVAVQGQVVVQFWLRPGGMATTLGVVDKQKDDRILRQLRVFL